MAGSRPLTEWLLQLLPAGGTGYVRPTWSEARKNRLANRFLGSEFGKPLDDTDHRDLLDQFLWFGTDYGPGDPLRWSPVAVEILLADWIPRKIVAPAAYLSKAPTLLRAFIRFCHAERKIRTTLTDQTLAAVDEYEAEYQQVIRSPRPQGPMALLAAIGVLGDQEPWEDEHLDLDRHFLEQLAEEVGGEDALDSLDDTPLPEEKFCWDEVPADVCERMGRYSPPATAAAATYSAPSTGRRAGGCWPAPHRPVRHAAQDNKARGDRGRGVLGDRKGQPALGPGCWRAAGQGSNELLQPGPVKRLRARLPDHARGWNQASQCLPSSPPRHA